MFDIKTAREEMAALRDEAQKHIDTYSAADATPATEEAQTAQDSRFARLEKLAKDIDAQEKLAEFAYSSNEKPTEKPAAKVTLAKTPDQQTYSAPSAPTREDYSRALTEWARGSEPETYATISVSGNSAVIPQIVTAPITPVKYNCYKAAAQQLGIASISLGNTAETNTPVITSTSGGAVPDGTQNTPNDANPSFGNILTRAQAYQSKTYWFQNEVINAEQWDVTTSVLPALVGAREYGFASAISDALIADSGITQSVTTASATTIIIDNLDALIHSFPLAYDDLKAIFVGMDVYAACEQLKDSNGRPIFEMFTIQDQNFVAYKGVPVFKHDSFQALTTANNVVGVAVSFVGFKLRDEKEKLIQYVDQAGFVDQTGFNNVKYQGWGYVPAAVTKLIAG